MEIEALQEIISYNDTYFNVILNFIRRDNKYGYKDQLLSEDDLNDLENYIDKKKFVEIENFLYKSLKESEDFRKWAIDVLNNYFIIWDEEELVLQRNPFLERRNLPDIKKYLSISNLKVRTLNKLWKIEKKF
jgi:hypothetical protein